VWLAVLLYQGNSVVAIPAVAAFVEDLGPPFPGVILYHGTLAAGASLKVVVDRLKSAPDGVAGEDDRMSLHVSVVSSADFVLDPLSCIPVGEEDSIVAFFCNPGGVTDSPIVTFAFSNFDAVDLTVLALLLVVNSLLGEVESADRFFGNGGEDTAGSILATVGVLDFVIVGLAVRV
jgi:hypothetical protein